MIEYKFLFLVTIQFMFALIVLKTVVTYIFYFKAKNAQNQQDEMNIFARALRFRSILNSAFIATWVFSLILLSAAIQY